MHGYIFGGSSQCLKLLEVVLPCLCITPTFHEQVSVQRTMWHRMLSISYFVHNLQKQKTPLVHNHIYIFYIRETSFDRALEMSSFHYRKQLDVTGVEVNSIQHGWICIIGIPWKLVDLHNMLLLFQKYSGYPEKIVKRSTELE
jgi:hypothetical protein